MVKYIISCVEPTVDLELDAPTNYRSSQLMPQKCAVITVMIDSDAVVVS